MWLRNTQSSPYKEVDWAAHLYLRRPEGIKTLDYVQELRLFVHKWVSLPWAQQGCSICVFCVHVVRHSHRFHHFIILPFVSPQKYTTVSSEPVSKEGKKKLKIQKNLNKPAESSPSACCLWSCLFHSSLCWSSFSSIWDHKYMKSPHLKVPRWNSKHIIVSVCLSGQSRAGESKAADQL